MPHEQLLILGSGPAGCTAALYAARAGLSPLVLEGELPLGQLTLSSEVDNFISWHGEGVPRDGYSLISKMKSHAEAFGSRFEYDTIVDVNFEERPFTLVGKNETYTADSVIIGTGASARWLGLESEERYKNRGVSACATCDGYFYSGKPVVVVGGGNTAVEEALVLSQICSHVTVVHRRDRFRGEKVMHDRLLAQENVTVEWDHVLEEVCGDAEDRGVGSVRIKHVRSGEIKEIPCEGCFIAIGHTPNTSIFEGKLELDHGYIVVNGGQAGYATQTSVPGVYAAGDVMDHVYRQAITSAGTGCQAALDAVRFLEENQ